MKKIEKILIILFLAFTVFAVSTDVAYAKSYTPDTNVQSCEGLLGAEFVNFLNDEVFLWVKIAVPIILIIMCTIDFAKAVINNDKDALAKATSNVVKRCIVAVAIFFLPFIIIYVMKNASVGGTPIMEDPLCGLG